MRCHANGIVFWQAAERLRAAGQNLAVVAAAAAAALPQPSTLEEEHQHFLLFFFLSLLSERPFVLLSQQLCSRLVWRPFWKDFRLTAALMVAGRRQWRRTPATPAVPLTFSNVGSTEMNTDCRDLEFGGASQDKRRMWFDLLGTVVAHCQEAEKVICQKEN